MPHTFHPVDHVPTYPRPGLLFTGPWPIPGTIRKHGDSFYDWSDVFREPWLVVHEEARAGQLYRIVGVESFRIPILSCRQPVGLLVREWDVGDAQTSARSHP